MNRVVWSVLLGVVGRWMPERMAGALANLAGRYAEGRTSEEALRFLLELDNRLYDLEGRFAVAYGDGTHTKHRHTGYHDFFVKRIRADEKVLDIGCGIGALAWDVAERSGARVTAIDMSEANIEEARTRRAHPNVTYVHGDALTDLPRAHYDVVILSNVLEHFGDRVGFLRQVREAVVPQRWLIRVPVFERDWRAPLKKELGLEWRLDPSHYTEYTLESFREEIGSAGLAIVHIEVRWGEIWAELTSTPA